MILRRVTKAELGGACRYTGYRACRYFLTLECGHEQTRKASDGVPKRARCNDCELLARGGTITYGEAE